MRPSRSLKLGWEYPDHSLPAMRVSDRIIYENNVRKALGIRPLADSEYRDSL